ncbi:hemolysin D [Robbsia andropogonis]|uniref:Hemolysin D n=1 Tax=Robbsia andropogonis TaxID=28092 RepID=A0A0F5K204_9BURK|nr:EmrA/EmrK family multidrug efflux transporter periplasmic adaptor subunit [Robbsia andropogonis]KKB63965.1 hemolysin D [Robbsia andropogonis]MCP1120247.1 EmrA/EmrK family multidrug efflux transporter periplasmic adaptor subunit [Robbsia andropogonis]MCP1130107.1 EmrA/EmrK family multidrug efflux transporter periplasmic adaptor subunit [Robbsia andropogonis]
MSSNQPAAGTPDQAPNQTPHQGPGPQPPQPSSGRRALWLTIVALIVIAAAVAYGFYYFLVAQFHEETDDAYVNGNVVQITPQVTGTVVAVNADDTQTVKVGDPLIRLDEADAKVALEQAEASLAQAVRQVRTLYANTNAYQATVAERESDLAKARSDLTRRLAIARTGAVSAEEISHARDAVSSAQAALNAAKQQFASNRALTDNLTVSDHPNVKLAAAKVRDAYLNYARNTLPAPVSGFVAKRSVQVGQRVSPGTPLMAIVPLNEVWVDANFKEVQLRKVRIGQPVELTADAYGSSVVYHGHVQGFSAGTGSAFALLPAQNATGNWIKVVQRLPVRIALDPNELKDHPLRIGLSMDVDVDTHDQNGGLLASTKNTVYQTDVFAQYGAQADAEIAKIIADNVAMSGNAKSK